MIKVKKHLEKISRMMPKEPSRMFKQRLDRNERNEPFSDSFINKMKERITGELFMVYPEMEPVYEKMAKWLGISQDHIVLSPGSEQGIKSVFEAFISPGEKVLLHFPGFAMYQVYCDMFQAEVVRQDHDSNLGFDWEAYGKKITEGIRMVVVENPNGFLGICPTMVQLRRVVEKAAAAGAIALVDEAYFHFHDQTAVGWIGEFDNLIISRTFSKAFGLAGMRAGYMVSGKENIESLKKVRPAYELTSATAALVCGLIDNYGEVEKYLANTKRNLADLKKELAKHGIASSDSKANFIAARLGEAAVHDELRDRLARKGILIRRPFREDHLKEWVRISTSVPAVQKTILDELGKILKGVKR